MRPALPASMTGSTRAPADADDALLRPAAAVRDTGYRFVTVTPATHARVNARPGNAWARGPEDVFGWSRPFRPEVLPSAVFELMRRGGGGLLPGGGRWGGLGRLFSPGGE